MKKWTEAQDLILPDVRDCPWAMAQSRLILAAREFCSRSGAWRVKLDPIPAVAGVADYPEIAELRDTEIVRVLAAYIGIEKLQPVTPDEFFVLQVEHPQDLPERMTVEGDTLMIHGVPRESGAEIKVEAIFKPSLAATGLPDDLWNQYIEGIVEGAKALLYSSPDKPYTSAGLAALARERFIQAAGVARARTDSGMVRSRRRVRSHFF